VGLLPLSSYDCGSGGGQKEGSHPGVLFRNATILGEFAAAISAVTSVGVARARAHALVGRSPAGAHAVMVLSGTHRVVLASHFDVDDVCCALPLVPDA
jgi:hypothetical protein